jgi:1-deoxy-D-xylulose-5-phosphate reductoisomerase
VGERREVIILGSTGSIGRQALEVIDRNPERFRVVGLSAGGGQPGLLADQARAHGVTDVAVGEAESAELAARPADVVLNALAGAAGLMPTLRALEAGTALALANKESLIIGGPLVRERAQPGQIRPVDSEHSALAQCLMAGSRPEIGRAHV